MAPPRPTPLTRALVAGGAALILGGAALGVAGAQSATATPAPAATATPSSPGTPQRPGGPGSRGGQVTQQFWEAVARRLGVPSERLQQALAEARAEVGMTAPGGLGSQDRSGGPGRAGGAGDPGARGVPGGPRVRLAVDVAAQTIGVTPQQLRQELPGKSVADVARAHNVDPARVVEAMKNDANQRIDRAAADGRVAADQVQGLKDRSAQEIDRFVNTQTPVRPTRPVRATPTPAGS